MHMEIDDAQEAQILTSSAVSQAKRQLSAFLTDNTAPLLGTIRSYVQRMGLAQGEAVAAVALEVLQEVAVEALAHSARFRPDSQPMAWLLGISVNVIRRKKVEAAKRYQRELSFGRLTQAYPEILSESEFFEQFALLTQTGPEQEFEANEQANTILSLVSPEDQRILRLAFLRDFERESLARELGITPVAARVRLHRALARLRAAWQQHCNGSESSIERKWR